MENIYILVGILLRKRGKETLDTFLIQSPEVDVFRNGLLEEYPSRSCYFSGHLILRLLRDGSCFPFYSPHIYLLFKVYIDLLPPSILVKDLKEVGVVLANSSGVNHSQTQLLPFLLSPYLPSF